MDFFLHVQLLLETAKTYMQVQKITGFYQISLQCNYFDMQHMVDISDYSRI